LRSRGISDQSYNAAWPHTEKWRHNIYILNVVEEYDDIYID